MRAQTLVYSCDREQSAQSLPFRVPGPVVQLKRRSQDPRKPRKYL